MIFIIFFLWGGGGGGVESSKKGQKLKIEDHHQILSIWNSLGTELIFGANEYLH